MRLNYIMINETKSIVSIHKKLPETITYSTRSRCLI